MRIFFRLGFLFFFVLLVSCKQQKPVNPEITQSELYDHIDFLASDSLQGRQPGTPFDRVAAKYIKDAMHASGIQLLGRGGYQFFEFIEKQDLGSNNFLRVGSNSYEHGNDYALFPFSSNDTTSSSIVFVGFGFRINSDELIWDDYLSVNVNGKWAMILRGTPDDDNPNSPLEPFSGDRHKAMVAKDQGATGVIFVSGPKFDEEDKLISLDLKSFDIGIPVIQMKRELADHVIKPCGHRTADLEKSILKTRRANSFNVATRVDARTHLISIKGKTQNVVGLVQGTHPVLKNQYIVIGAHYDHLGMGGENSSSRIPDTLAVHNGADDNASGVAAILEIAQKFAYNKPQRSIIVVAFGAEERGLMGSRFFTENPLIPLDSISAMINIDMLGRLGEERNLQISGVKTSLQSDSIISNINKKYGFKLTLSPQGYGPSDHASFYTKDVPVLFFSTGPHIDYHTPFDVIEMIDFEGLTECTNFIFDLTSEIASIPEMLTFQEAGPKIQYARHGANLKVRLGIMPDVSGAYDDGLHVLAVNPEQPAYMAGIEKGDILTAINGKEIKNIQDYMYRLQELKPGTTVSVELISRGDIKIVLVQL